MKYLKQLSCLTVALFICAFLSVAECTNIGHIFCGHLHADFASYESFSLGFNEIRYSEDYHLRADYSEDQPH